MQTDGDDDPNTVWPGTNWEQVRGRFLYGAGDSHAAGETGGAESVALTIDQVPAHSHTVPAHGHSMTQPAFTLPSHTHNVELGSHSHSTCRQNGTAAKGTGVPTGPFAASNIGSSGYTTIGTSSTNLGTKTSAGPNSTPACTRTTNAAVSDKAAFGTENAGGGQRMRTCLRTYASTRGGGSRSRAGAPKPETERKAA